MKTKRNNYKQTMASILILTATTIGLSACGGGGDSSGGQYSAVSADSACGIPNYHAELQNYLNAKRASGTVVCGSEKMPAVNKLTWHSALQGTAVVYAAKAAGGDTSLSGINQHAAASYSYRNGSPMLISNQESPQGVIDGLMGAGVDYCKQMVSSLYKEIGASCARSDAGVPFHVIYMAGG